MTTPRKPPPGMVDIADTLIEEADALGSLVFDLDGNLVADTRKHVKRDEPAAPPPRSEK